MDNSLSDEENSKKRSRNDDDAGGHNGSGGGGGGGGDDDDELDNEHQTSKSRGAVTVQIFIKSMCFKSCCMGYLLMLEGANGLIVSI